jgi:hypothetical protein
MEALIQSIMVLVKEFREHRDGDEGTLEGIPGQLREIRRRLHLLHCQTVPGNGSFEAYVGDDAHQVFSPTWRQRSARCSPNSWESASCSFQLWTKTKFIRICLTL